MNKRFRIAFSFAAEKRNYVAEVARVLANRLGAEQVLYDRFHEAEFARPDLAFRLQDLYFAETELLVVVLCRNYDRRAWLGLEWSAIYDRLRKQQTRDVVLCRFDRVEGVGLYGLAGFIELDEISPDAAARFLLERLADVEGHRPDHYLAAPPRRSDWLAEAPAFDWLVANQTEARVAFTDLVSRDSRSRILSINGPSGVGKTLLARQFIGNALRLPDLRCGLLDFKGASGMDDAVALLAEQLEVSRPPSSGSVGDQLGALASSLGAAPTPTLLIFDTVEAAGKLWQVVDEHFLSVCVRSDWLRIVISGQRLPSIDDDPAVAMWVRHVELSPPTVDDWFRFGQAFRTDLPREFVASAYALCDGRGPMLAPTARPCARDMNFAEQIEILKAAQNDPALLALATVDFAYPALDAAERARIKSALLAAAVPHWCDRDFLAVLLESGANESDRLFGYLSALTAVEPFVARGVDAIAVQRDQRLTLRRHFQSTETSSYWQTVERARLFCSQTEHDHGRIEALYHLFSLDRAAARQECIVVQAELERSGSADGDRLLVSTLMELIEWCPTRPAIQPRSPASADRIDPGSSDGSPRRDADREQRFHVFLCYNSEDRPAVESIAKQLKARRIVPWFDWWELPPGRAWQAALEAQIETIGSAAVFVGQSGLGPWQDVEVRAILSQFIDRDCSAIPVILPSVEKKVPSLPLFLRGNRFIDFRDLEDDPLSMLIWGITGERPDALR